MAIKQVMTTTVDGVVIGLSDTIDNLIQAGEFTIANLQPYMIVGQSTVGNQSYASLEAAERNYTGSGGSTPAWFPANNTGSKGGVTVEFQAKAASSLTLPHVSYGRNILLYGTLQLANEPQQIRADNMSGLDFRVVTSIDYKKIYYDVEMAANTYSYVAPEAGSATYYQTGSQGCVRTIDNDEVTNCYVYSIFGDDDDWYCIKDWMFPADDSASYPWHMCCEQYISGNFDNTYSTLSTGYTNYTTTKTMFRWTGEQTNATYGGDSWNWNNSGNLVAINGDIVQACNYTGASAYAGNCHNIITGLDNALKQLANAGLKFKWNDTWYKPIAEGGIITGYTDDMTEESEWDDITDVIGNIVPATPGGGGGGGDDDDDDDPSDDQAWGGAYSGAGAFSKFYLCTSTDLANLRTWFGGGGSGDKIPDGFDPMGQVLGLLQYPVSISGTALAPDEITFRSGKTILHTGVSADRSTGGFLHIDCGSVEIPRRMQERGVPFLDFETSLEIYVPFCGTAPLDVQTCVGKTLTCDLYVATATGDVSAVIAAGGHPVAYMSGNMAESLPISSSGYGMYLAACKSTWGNGVSQVMNQLTGGTTSTIKNVNQAALNETLSYGQTGGWGQSELLAESYNNPAIGRGMAGAASAKGVAAIGLTTTALNVANAASTGYEQYQRVKNASYTSVSGSFTSCAAWNYPFTPYVKITRPHKQIPTGGRGDYKHTAAIPLVETRSLSGAPGLTTCVNPDVSGIANATAQEKDIIYRALVNGVIV